MRNKHYAGQVNTLKTSFSIAIVYYDVKRIIKVVGVNSMANLQILVTDYAKANFCYTDN